MDPKHRFHDQVGNQAQGAGFASDCCCSSPAKTVVALVEVATTTSSKIRYALFIVEKNLKLEFYGGKNVVMDKK